jgi:hypothetical protein
VTKKFTGALAKPIQAPPIPYVHIVHPQTAEAKAFAAAWSNEISRQRMGKLLLLAQHYGVTKSRLVDISGAELFFLFYWLALDTVPGFQTTDVRKRSGRPKDHNAELRLATAEFLKANGFAKTDGDAAAIIAEAEIDAENAKKSKPSRVTNSEKGRRARTVANMISSTRKSAQRKAAGKIN